MCCFSRPVRHVSATRIFARSLPAQRQALIYAMQIAASKDVAMVLPIPVPAGSAEDAVDFVDLSGYETFFTDLDRAFPAPISLSADTLMSRAAPAPPRTLEVQRVGAFDASFVPRVNDFERLDPRFRLPAGVWDRLEGYEDWGFAVFKLRKTTRGLGLLARRRSVHPMAFTFPRRDGAGLFFPTVHVHDGEVHPTAEFDHQLYWQGPENGEDAVEGTYALQSYGPAKEFVEIDRASGLVDPDAPPRKLTLSGSLPNQDLHLRSV